MSNLFGFRKATLAEQYNILSEPRLLKILEQSPSLEELADYLVAKKLDCYLASYGKYRTLVEIYPIKGQLGLYSFHVAMPSDSLRVSRYLMLAVLRYIFTELTEVQTLTTTCPEGIIANMCRKVKATEVNKQDNMVTFKLSKVDIKID